MFKITGLAAVMIAMAFSQPAMAHSPDGTWIKDSRSGCAIWNQHPEPNETITWSGECRDGKAAGYGKINWFENGRPNGWYEGSYRNGMMNGIGYYEWPSGNDYFGDWIDGNMYGSGRMEWANGDFYEGEWQVDYANGYGVYYDYHRDEELWGIWAGDCHLDTGFCL